MLLKSYKISHTVEAVDQFLTQTGLTENKMLGCLLQQKTKNKEMEMPPPPPTPFFFSEKKNGFLVEKNNNKRQSGRHLCP